jgi:hypothetical protein
MIGVGTALALLVLFLRRDLFYALVVDWAVLGILLKRTAEPRTSAPGVSTAALVSLCILTVAIIVQLARGRVYR